MGQATDKPANDATAAMALLGVTAQMSWREVRSAYHERIREVHPDVADSASATELTAELNRALDLLRDATDSGARPFFQPDSGSNSLQTSQQPRRSDVVTMHAAPGDVFVLLLDAAHMLGTVNYMDPESGLIKVLLAGTSTAAELFIEVDQSVSPVLVAFTLETTTFDTTLDIHDVVAGIASAIS